MILVDTSVWAQHIDRSVGVLSVLLERAEVLSHPFVIGEIATGNLQRRDAVLRDFAGMRQAVVASDEEVLRLIDRNRLFGRGIGYIDAHLIAATLLSADTRLWTFDKRLEAVAVQCGVAYTTP